MSDPSATRRFAGTFVLVVAVALLSCAGVVYVVDPWHMFHRSWIGPDLYLENQRIANAGIVQTGEMSIATIGSSMMENIRKEDIEAIFGGEAMPLAISGSTAYEQSIVARAALRRPSLRTLVWGLDWFSFMFPVHQGRQNRPFPIELYAFTLEGRLKYLFGLDPLLDSVRLARIWMGGPRPDDLSPDPFALHNRDYDPSDGNAKTVLERAAQSGYHRDWQAIRATMKCDMETLAGNIRENLEPTLRSMAAGQRAYLYFVPYSEVQMAFFQRYMPECFELMPAFRLMIAEAVAPFAAKVSLHDPQDRVVPADDLRNYTDPLHHVGLVDRMILEAVRSGRIEVDRATVVAAAKALQAGWVEAYSNYRYLFPAAAQ